MASKNPQHVAVVMDGNGRWALQQGLVRSEGHQAGARNCMDIIHAAIDNEVKVLSLYAFSTENWKRPDDEVKTIYSILDCYLQTEILNFLKRGVKFVMIGDKSQLSRSTKFWLNNAERLSKSNKGMLLQLAVNYGGKDDIIRAVKQMAEQQYDFSQLDEQSLDSYLDGASTLPVDLVIRTSGEQRLSNFMIWQAAYAEYYFTDTLWPDFDVACFEQALQEYQNRQRRFGHADSTNIASFQDPQGTVNDSSK